MKGNERNGKERKGKESKGKERKPKERKGGRTCDALLQTTHPGDSARVRRSIFVQRRVLLSLPEHVSHLLQVLAIPTDQIQVLALQVSSNDAAV